MALLKEGAESHDIAAQIGVTPGQIAAVKAHISMGTYGAASNATEAEADLAITDDDREQAVASGRIDITARDQEGTIVVVELKVGAA